MSAPLAELGPKGLATELDRRAARMDKASAAVRALAAHGMERWCDTIARLGAEHPAVVKHDGLERHYREVIGECQRRYSEKAVTFESMWPTFLRVRAVR